MTQRDPVNPTDKEAIALAKDLLEKARFGALAVTHPDTCLLYTSDAADDVSTV